MNGVENVVSNDIMIVSDQLTCRARRPKPLWHWGIDVEIALARIRTPDFPKPKRDGSPVSKPPFLKLVSSLPTSTHHTFSLPSVFHVYFYSAFLALFILFRSLLLLLLLFLQHSSNTQYVPTCKRLTQQNLWPNPSTTSDDFLDFDRGSDKQSYQHPPVSWAQITNRH
jgi:hypothetical protein